MTSRSNRRNFVTGLATLGGVTLVGCGTSPSRTSSSRVGVSHAPPTGGSEVRTARVHEPAAARVEEPRPGEDLMTEHGVAMRVLAVWHEVIPDIREGLGFDAAPLRASIEVVKQFIEGGHARVEEAHVFDRLAFAGQHLELVGILREQHQVGARLTSEALALLGGPLDTVARQNIADRLASFRRMYVAHTSREDTVVFPAFRELAGPAYAEWGEEIEHHEEQLVGRTGLSDAMTEIARIERELGLEDLRRFTPPQSA